MTTFYLLIKIRSFLFPSLTTTMEELRQKLSTSKGKQKAREKQQWSTEEAEERRGSAREIADDIEANHTERELAPMSLYSIMKEEAKWEGWVSMVEEEMEDSNPDKEHWQDAYHAKVFTLGKHKVFTYQCYHLLLI
jgi:hypothetical protein